MTCKHDVKIALRHYRYLKSFCMNAVDSLDWYLWDYKLSSQIRSITHSRLNTFNLMMHIDRALATYGNLCRQDGTLREYNIIMKKFIEPFPKGVKAYSNEQLAEMFDCSAETVTRAIRSAYDHVAILFFGLDGLKFDKTVNLMTKT